MATDSELLAIRRRLYADALRRGDPLATANAAARLRAHIGDLAASELDAVRASRRNFGQAIRQARTRRVAPPLQPSPARGILLTRPRRRPFAVAAAFAMLALVLASLIAQPFLADENEGGAGGAPVAVASDAVLPVVQSRGRVVLAVTTVATAVEEPATTAPPETPASASPAPTSGAGVAAGSARPSGSGAPGTGTGSGTGGGNGSGSPSPAPTITPSPRPTNAICLSSVPRGFARLCGLVVDSRTGRGIAGACVSLGPCNAQSARTDPNGRWTFTLPVGNGTLTWILEFANANYRTVTFRQTSRQGLISIPTQRLVAAP